MAIFDSKETEKRYYEVIRKYGIVHILWEKGHVVTLDDIDCLLASVHGETDQQITHEPFCDFP